MVPVPVPPSLDMSSSVGAQALGGEAEVVAEGMVRERSGKGQVAEGACRSQHKSEKTGARVCFTMGRDASMGVK